MKAPVYNAEWSSEVQRIYEHDMREIWDPSIARHIYNQYHAQLDLYMREVPATQSLRVLDVGCAQATLALMLAEKGHRVTAVDLRKEFVEYAKTRHTSGDITFVVGDALEFDSDQKFDVIFANQIVEHLVYPVEFLQGLGALLDKGGRMVVTTPNHGYLKNAHPSFRELGDPKQFEHMQNTADGDGHFFAYSGSELRSIAEEAGFATAEVMPFETPWISGHLKFRYLHGVAPHGLLSLLDRVTRAAPFVGERLSHQLMLRLGGYTRPESVA